MNITASDLMTVEAIIGYGAVVNFQDEPFGFSLTASVENITDNTLSYQRYYPHVEIGAMKALGTNFILYDFADNARYSFEKHLKKVATV